VKIIIHGPLAGPGPHGGPALQSWGPDQLVEVDDGDKVAVAWARGWAATDHATLVEDAAEDKPKEHKAAAEAPHEPEKRGPGRPRKNPAE
jgi:hypothetical protein